MNKKSMYFGIAVIAILAMFFTSFGGAVDATSELTSTSEKSIKNVEVNVVGEANIVVSPDMATIRIGVTNEGETAEVAKSENAKAMNSVISSLKKLGIAEKDIQTSNYSIYPDYDWSQKHQGENKIIGYTVSNTLNVTVRNIDNVGKVVDISTKAGSNIINGINFDYSNRTEAYNKALSLAVKEAEAKALSMAKANDSSVKVVKATSLTEVESYNYQPMYYAKDMMLNSVESATPIQEGEMTITAKVQATFEY